MNFVGSAGKVRRSMEADDFLSVQPRKAKTAFGSDGKDSDSTKDAGSDSTKESSKDSGSDSTKDTSKDSGSDSTKDSTKESGSDTKDTTKESGCASKKTEDACSGDSNCEWKDKACAEKAKK